MRIKKSQQKTKFAKKNYSTTEIELKIIIIKRTYKKMNMCGAVLVYVVKSQRFWYRAVLKRKETSRVPFD